MSGKRRKKKIRGRIIFGIELAIIILLSGGLFVFAKLNEKLSQIQEVPVDLNNVNVNDGLSHEGESSGYRTIAVVGVDSRDESEEGGNSDTMMLVVLDDNNKTIKIMSLYRDTYLNIGNDTYTKSNAAYNRGGAERFLSMLNQNLDLNITDFVTVDFSAIIDVIDHLGGIEMNLTANEVVMMNDYCEGTSEITGKEYKKIEPEVEGTYELSGIQATSYMRIRYGEGLEFRRTLRQRAVLYKMLEKLKAADLPTLYNMLDDVLGDIYTNISKQDIVKLGLSVRGYQIEGTEGFPFDHKWGENVKERMDGLDCIVPVTLLNNVEKLHAFLYPNLEYVPTETVKEYSQYIMDMSGYTEADIPSSSEHGGEMPS